MPRGVPKSGQRADAGIQKVPFVEVPCTGCGTTVKRKESEVRSTVFCSRQCYRDNAHALPRPDGAGRPPGETAVPHLCSDGQVRTSTLRPDGYRHIWWPENPSANASGRVTTHRDVMEGILGRPLLRTETVHHRNGDRSDNSPENLQLWSKAQPPGQAVEDKLAFARAILGLYGTDTEQITYGPQAVLLS